MRKLSITITAALLLSPIATCDAQQPVYRDSTATIDKRLADLIAQMTIDEKIAQLRCLNNASNLTANRFAATFPNGIGEIGPIDFEAEREVTQRNAIQKYLMESTRLGIPAIFHDEACHGFRSIGATSFPVPIGMAGSWDPELIERIYSVIAAEARARGVSHVLAPVVDITRDPRWGRTDETMGEDPYLNGKLGAAMVRGMQGSADGTIRDGHVATTLKHFTGHGAPQAGINRAPAQAPLRDIYDAHLVPFRIAIAEAHPASIMPSYNEVDGVPSHANTWLLQDVLRKQFGFTGLVVSDYTGVEYLASVHGLAANNTEAAFKAFQAGVDVNLPDGRSYPSLKQLVDDKRIAMEKIDAAAGRVLRLKFAMGLFEHPYGDSARAIELANLDSSKTLAREAAAKSIVLLKNSNNILPLSKDRYKTIAVIGPNANQARLGSYSGEPLYKVTLLDGIKKKIGESAKVVYAQGCDISENVPDSSLQAWQRGQNPRFPAPDQTRASIAEAVNIAKDSDLILLVLGENEMISRESWAGNHLGDRSSLELAGGQSEFATAMLALGKPVVVYLMNGRPIAMPEIVEKADAVIEGWYMGQETGNAAADVLFGDVNPSGKLTISIPRATGQVPIYYNHKPGAAIYNYVDESNQPLFPFGFGLSYTSFEYSEPTLSSASMQKDGQATLTTTVTNTGGVAGDEIVQFYIHQRIGSVTHPVKELRGFKRVSLAPGASVKVEFTIGHDTLAAHDINLNYTVEASDYDLMVGPSSATAKRVVLHVTE